MYIYDYDNIELGNSLGSIHIAVAESLMTNKTILYCIWKESTSYLVIYFENEISVADKLILDSIVVAVS